LCSAPLITRCLIHLDHAARLVWDKWLVTADGLLQITSNRFFLEPRLLGQAGSAFHVIPGVRERSRC